MRWSRPFGAYLLALFLGLIFFAASLTPSLIPRGWVVQGVLGGLVAALGYVIGRFAVFAWHQMGLPVLTGRRAVAGHAILAVPVAVVVALCLGHALEWQNGIRERMGMDPLATTHALRMTALAAGVFAVLFLLGTALRIGFDWLRRRLYRLMPRRTANAAGLVVLLLVVFVVTRDGVYDRAVSYADRSYTLAQDLFDTAPPAPSRARVTGGPGSLVDWDAMGKPGRDFVTGGPSASSIYRFTGRPSEDPVRVYVGLAQASSAQTRAEVALAELRRQGGFEREVLIVAMPTGTGWLDPSAIDPVEYLHDGDVATVAVQYSYLQSPLALILETDAGLAQAKALIGTVHDYWRGLPEEDRPRLYVHGLSLGAWASMHGTDLFALLDDPIDGALWVGPPFPSAKWQGIVAERDPASAYVSPRIGDDRLVRFASHQGGAGGPDGWGDMRIVYLQYTSDPIVFYEPASLFRRPPWMRQPPAPDVSPDLRFMPVVTQFQLAIDMALATTAPPGHGHAYYGPDYVRPWIAVTNPDPWTEAETVRLIEHCDEGFKGGCAD